MELSPSLPQKKKFPVLEIFGPTIQGEGSVIGQQTLFVRFGGCDYRCKKCDSLHAVIPEEVQKHATYMDADEIITRLREYEPTGVRWVTLSGGNPLMHQLGELVTRIKNELGMLIAVETQGTIWADWVMNCDAVTVSPKAPGMGEKFEPKKFEWFITRLGYHPGFVVKVVVFNIVDLQFVAHLVEMYPHLKQIGALYISLGNEYPPTIDGSDSHFDLANLLINYQVLVDEILADNRLRSAIVLPQWHVILWGNKKGV